MAYGGDRKSDKFKENQFRQNGGAGSSTETAKRLAEEHNISPRSVERSADLFRSHQAVKEVAPEVAEKVESGKIKVSEKDSVAVRKALLRAYPERKSRLLGSKGGLQEGFGNCQGNRNPS